MKQITQKNHYQEEIKKSRFICLASPVFSSEEAMKFIEDNSDPGANHNCWAWKVGNDYRFNDDGEPSGTAGKPIYSAIDHQELTNVVVLVIRWFGGVKLGTGGLCRAYGGVAAKCLNDTPQEEIVAKVDASVEFPYDMIKQIYHFLEENSLPKLSEEYTQDGIRISTELIEAEVDLLKEKLQNFSSGKLNFNLSKES